MSDYMTALHEVEVARNHFENATPDYIDAAIHELLYAEQRLNAEIVRTK